MSVSNHGESSDCLAIQQTLSANKSHDATVALHSGIYNNTAGEFESETQTLETSRAKERHTKSKSCIEEQQGGRWEVAECSEPWGNR